MRFYADKFLEVLNALLGLREVLQRYPPNVSGTTEFLGDESFEDGLNHLGKLFNELDMPLSKTHINDIISARKNGEEWEIKAVIDRINMLYSSIIGEMKNRVIIAIKPSHAKYYDSPEPFFGQNVVSKFPSAAYEIDEALKCFALGRYTASVFHLMRILEISIRAASTALGIPSPVKGADRNWGNILRKIKTEFDRRRNKGSTGWKNNSDKVFFEEIYVSLDAVRTAWRNATMHVDKTYTAEDTEQILFAVRGFMKKIATRLDEQGQPLA